MEENNKVEDGEHWPPAPQIIPPEPSSGRRSNSLTGSSILDGILGFFIGLVSMTALTLLMSALEDAFEPAYYGLTEGEYIHHQELLFCAWMVGASLFALLCRIIFRRLKVFGIASAIGGLMIVALLTWYYQRWFAIVFLGAPLSHASPG